MFSGVTINNYISNVEKQVRCSIELCNDQYILDWEGIYFLFLYKKIVHSLSTWPDFNYSIILQLPTFSLSILSYHIIYLFLLQLLFLFIKYSLVCSFSLDMSSFFIRKHPADPRVHFIIQLPTFFQSTTLIIYFFFILVFIFFLLLLPFFFIFIKDSLLCMFFLTWWHVILGLH